jgi:hypothetical protein
MKTRGRLLPAVGLAGAALIATLSIGCGSSPTNPGSVTPPAPPPSTAVNTPPVIDGITASATRAEVDTDVTLTATVHDAETPVSQLKFEWKADAGTFTGTGATVTWRAPKGVATPVNYTIKLTVTETFGTGGSQTNVVDGSAPAIRVHDSPKELGAIGTTFLDRFGDSSVSPQTCLVDFSDGCSGKADELHDIERNRKHFLILSHSLGTPRVTYVPSANRADMIIRGTYTSRIVNCTDWPTAEWGPCVLNSVGTVTFDDSLPSVYENGRWWLCASHALGVGNVSPAMRSFLRTLGRPSGTS